MSESGAKPDQKVWSRELGVGALARALEGHFELTDKDRKLHELAMRYHAECEAYDRTVCTGPVREGFILPMGPREMGLINRNAREVLARILSEAYATGIGRSELLKEISRCA